MMYEFKESTEKVGTQDPTQERTKVLSNQSSTSPDSKKRKCKSAMFKIEILTRSESVRYFPIEENLQRPEGHLYRPQAS